MPANHPGNQPCRSACQPASRFVVLVVPIAHHTTRIFSMVWWRRTITTMNEHFIRKFPSITICQRILVNTLGEEEREREGRGKSHWWLQVDKIMVYRTTTRKEKGWTVRGRADWLGQRYNKNKETYIRYKTFDTANTDTDI